MVPRSDRDSAVVADVWRYDLGGWQLVTAVCFMLFSCVGSELVFATVSMTDLCHATPGDCVFLDAA